MNRTIQLVGSFALAALAAWGGYILRGWRGDNVSSISNLQIPPLEFYVENRSFSEIENARRQLEAAVRRTLDELRAARWQVLRTGGPVENRERYVTAALDELRAVAEDLRDTGLEAWVLKDLLFLLKQEKLADPWLDVYLDSLYRNPAGEIASQFRGEAIRLAEATGRVREVQTALYHLGSIPSDLPTRRWGSGDPKEPDIAGSLARWHTLFEPAGGSL